MNSSESNDFQNEEYRFQEDEDYIDFEEIWQNDMMKYENDSGNIDLVNDGDQIEEDMNQSEMLKVSSTLCMRENELDESEEDSQLQGTQSIKNMQFWDIVEIDKEEEQEQRRTCKIQIINSILQKRKIKMWSEEEDKNLEDLFQIYKGKWEIIVKFLDGRTVSQCKQHWQRLSGGQEKKKKWTEEENQIILSFTKDNPQFNNWALIASSMKYQLKREMQGRNGKQIREHYMNQLRPGIKNKQGWTEEDDKLLLNLYQRYGSKWCQINKHFEGRTEIMLKNRFNKLQKGNTYIDHFLNIDDEPHQFQQSHTFSFN